jgi:hypothetical protein
MRDAVWEQDQDRALARPCILRAELELQLEMARGAGGGAHCARLRGGKRSSRRDAHLGKEKGGA